MIEQGSINLKAEFPIEDHREAVIDSKILIENSNRSKRRRFSLPSVMRESRKGRDRAETRKTFYDRASRSTAMARSSSNRVS